MRLNQYIAQATGLSRRAADDAIAAGRVTVNGQTATVGQIVHPADQVSLDNQLITPSTKTTLMLNKPVGYICSREGQGSPTIYDLLPEQYRQLKPVGRLDKDSSGLLLLTNDGALAHELTHPRFQKEKLYEVKLDHALSEKDFQKVTGQGVELEDGLSKFALHSLGGSNTTWRVTMSEGRNRQIRRTFAALGYVVVMLHRIQFGHYQIGYLQKGHWQRLS